MIKKISLGVLALVGVAVGGFVLMLPPRVDVGAYASLVTPRLTTRADQRVLEVVARGKPDEIAGPAIGLLFRTFIGLEGTRMLMPVAPKARWLVNADTPKEEYVGVFALPAPDGLETLPEPVKDDGLEVTVSTWAYGEVAEILHVGPYDTEQPTLDRLRAFIEAQGYEIAGPHEEEYVKGPGWFFDRDPEKYQTVLRYRVKKVEPTAAALVEGATGPTPSGPNTGTAP